MKIVYLMFLFIAFPVLSGDPDPFLDDDPVERFDDPSTGDGSSSGTNDNVSTRGDVSDPSLQKSVQKDQDALSGLSHEEPELSGSDTDQGRALSDEAARRREEQEHEEAENIDTKIDKEIKVLKGTEELAQEDIDDLNEKLKNSKEKLATQVKEIRKIIENRDKNISNVQKFIDRLASLFGKGEKAALVKDLKMYENQVKVLDNANNLIKSSTDVDYLRVRAKEILKSAGDSPTRSDIVDSIKEQLSNLHEKQGLWLEKAKNNIKSADDITFVKYLAGLEEKFSPGEHNISKILNYAHEGDVYIDQVKNETLTKNSGEIDERRDQIKKIQWSLYEKSIAQDPRGFSSGMIQIDAPAGGKLYEFIDSIQTGDKTTGSYDRWSSHYEGQKITSRGLDFRNEVGELDLGSLPNGRSHLHYGRLPDDRMYIKWEFHGLATPKETLAHMFDFAQTRGLQGLGLKEHMPSFIKSGFDQIVEDNSIELSASEKKQIKNKGISGIQDVLQSKSSEALQTFDGFIKEFNFSKDFGANRKGNELILNLD